MYTKINGTLINSSVYLHIKFNYGITRRATIMQLASVSSLRILVDRDICKKKIIHCYVLAIIFFYFFEFKILFMGFD